MILYLMILCAVMVGVMLFTRQRAVIYVCGVGAFVVMGGVVLAGIFGPVEQLGELGGLFVFDTLGLSYGALMALVGGLVAWRSRDYLDQEPLRQLRIYYVSLVLLGVCLLGVFLSGNAAVSWIFLEATTIAAGGLIYHRRTVRALEATWKYIFVSSIGIAVAYLGVLLLSTTGVESLNYQELAGVVATDAANPLYMKIAFLFLLLGYSTKLEIFPLFTVGVDANHSCPAPASAFLSSAMVGGGFVAIFRVYTMFQSSPIFGWVMNLLLLTGVVSLLFAAVYMGRTGNFKRLLGYSTVEHSGLVLLGLGMGGVGVFIALLHSLSHTVIKAVGFLQLSQVGRLYQSYKIGQITGYLGVDRMGSVVMVLVTMGLVAAPPSVLFLSEFLLFRQLIENGQWWLLVIVLLPLMGCAYWALSKLMWVVFGSGGKEPVVAEPQKTAQKFSPLSLVLLLLILGTMVVGVAEFEWLKQLIANIQNGI